ncbi:hypothetical protein Peur_022594 [Populus x canadensis]
MNSLWRSGLHAQHQEGFFLGISLLLKQLVCSLTIDSKFDQHHIHGKKCHQNFAERVEVAVHIDLKDLLSCTRIS